MNSARCIFSARSHNILFTSPSCTASGSGSIAGVSKAVMISAIVGSCCANSLRRAITISRASASALASASAANWSNNTSSPNKLYNCSVALTASAPTGNSFDNNAINSCCCSGVFGIVHVPSIRRSAQASNMFASFIAFPCCCMRAKIGKACSIRESIVSCTNNVLMSSMITSCPVISAGFQDSK